MSELQEIREHLVSIENKLDICLYGPDGESEKGMLIRLDRVEQSKKGTNKILWVTFLGIFGLVVQVIASRWGI